MEPSNEKQSDTVERARAFLAGVLERMDIDADIDVFEREDKIVLDIDCDDNDRLIGRRGQLVEALQHLISKISYRERSSGGGKPILVDVDGYRDKLIDKLIDLAERMADRALDDEEIVPLNPMSAHDRRVVHMTLADFEGVSTRSEGEGDDRHVLIVPDSLADA